MYELRFMRCYFTAVCRIRAKAMLITPANNKRVAIPNSESAALGSIPVVANVGSTTAVVADADGLGEELAEMYVANRKLDSATTIESL